MLKPTVSEKSGPNRCVGPNRPQPVGTSISRILPPPTRVAAHGKHAGSLKRFRVTIRKRYIVQRTNKAEIRLGEQCENTESCQENSWNEIQLKGP